MSTTTESRARSNPAFRNDIFSRTRAVAGEGVMTLGGTTAKSLLLIAVTIASTLYTWAHVAAHGSDPMLLYTGILGGFVVALLTIFRPHLARYTAPLYAVLEGLALGSISAVINAIPKYKGIPVTATWLAFLVVLTMLALYSARIIRVTDRLRSVVITATLAVALYYLLDLVLAFFGARMPLMAISSGWGGIAMSLVICGIASLNLLLDYDLIEDGVRNGAPKHMEWYGAFSLLVSIIWQWLELVKLLMRRK